MDRYRRKNNIEREIEQLTNDRPIVIKRERETRLVTSQFYDTMRKREREEEKKRCNVLESLLDRGKRERERERDR